MDDTAKRERCAAVNDERELRSRKFYPADQEAGFAKAAPATTPPTEHPAYRLAFTDADFLLREDLRPVRFQLELLKPEILLDEANIGSTLVIYGSARIPPPSAVETALAGAERLPAEEKWVVERLCEKSKYFDQAYELAHLVTKKALIEDGKRQFVVCSGGGPSIMEAANRGAAEAGGESIGLNIVLPHEQEPNPFITPDLSFRFHYFALRKMHFLIRAKAVAVFPGGFGTFDELFELLTLVQTGKMKPVPILLFGREFWTRVIDFAALVREGTISAEDLELITWCDSAEEAWEHITGFYSLDENGAQEAQESA